MRIGNKNFTTKSPALVLLNAVCYPMNFSTLYLSWVFPNDFTGISLCLVFLSLSLCSFAIYIMVDVSEEDLDIKDLVIKDLDVKSINVDNIKDNPLE